MSVGSINSSAFSQWSSALFSKLDTQNKGYVEKSDLQNAFGTSAISSTSSASPSDQLFQTLDADGDGKVTPQELTAGVKSLADALFANLRGVGRHEAGGAGGPPPPDGQGDDAGFTKDELTTMATDAGTGSRRGSMMSALVQNFAAADTDGDGKISRTEAHAFNKSSRVEGGSCGGHQKAAATDTAAGSTGSAGSPVSAQFLAFVKLLQLVGTFGQPQSNTSTVALAA